MFPELSSHRFLLKQILPADQQFIFRGLSHPQVIQHYGVSYQSFESTSIQMRFYDQLLNEGSGTWWKIEDRLTHNKVGAVGFNNYQPKHGKAELGYWLLPEYWGLGIIHEVLAIVISYLQEELKIHRIEAQVEEGNGRSLQVLEKLGFQHEGLLRDCEIKNDKFISLHILCLNTQQEINGF
jgi:[ribosomal protein S5]-alanine N-acetyltransferase